MKLCLRQADNAVYRWLSSVHLERYYQLFADAGYDLPTVSRMTPEVDFTLCLLVTNIIFEARQLTSYLTGHYSCRCSVTVHLQGIILSHSQHYCQRMRKAGLNADGNLSRDTDDGRVQGGAKKTGPPYFIANILKTP